jgi:hypothetical protein
MGLKEITKESFSFLGALGFSLVHLDDSELRFESPNCVLVISWDRRSGELEAFFGLPPTAGESQSMYSLTDALRMRGTLNLAAPPQINEDQLQPFVDQLAHQLVAYAQLGLTGDRKFFDQLEAFRSADAEAFTRNLKVAQVRAAIEQSWCSGDFQKIVELYTSIENHLSRAERAKLIYARKHQAN